VFYKTLIQISSYISLVETIELT